MEIDITAFVKAHKDHMERFSDSIANSGLENIGEITWANALRLFATARDWLIRDIHSLREHFADYGAWTRNELKSMTGQELNAMLVQEIAADYKEQVGNSESNEDSCGRLTRCRNPDGSTSWYYYIGI